jgi:hypothetical protein
MYKGVVGEERQGRLPYASTAGVVAPDSSGVAHVWEMGLVSDAYLALGLGNETAFLCVYPLTFPSEIIISIYL